MQELAVLTSRALTTARQFTAIADNVANANTDGFRRLDIDFKEVVSRPKGNPTASYVADRAQYIDFDSGVFQETGNPLSVALGNSKGFFAISVNGATQYTRNGAFAINNEGTLVTMEGHPVLDNGLGQIQIPQGTREILISRDGTIASEQGQLAQLGVFEFDDNDMQQLQRAGSTGFVADGVPNVGSENPMVIQGKIESSNVDAVKEMVTMRAASRAYQGSLAALRSLEQLEQSAIRNLGGTQ